VKTPAGTVIFDLDGVIYLGDVGVRGVNEALTAIEQRGYQIVFCTNNSSRTPSATARKIRPPGVSPFRCAPRSGCRLKPAFQAVAPPGRLTSRTSGPQYRQLDVSAPAGALTRIRSTIRGANIWM